MYFAVSDNLIDFSSEGAQPAPVRCEPEYVNDAVIKQTQLLDQRDPFDMRKYFANYVMCNGVPAMKLGLQMLWVNPGSTSLCKATHLTLMDSHKTVHKAEVTRTQLPASSCSQIKKLQAARKYLQVFGILHLLIIFAIRKI